VETSNQIIDLSIKGLRYGAILPAMDLAVLSQKLYAYNTLPIPMSWRSKQWDHHSIFPADILYADSETLLRTHWIPQPSRNNENYWLSWKPKKPTVHGIHPGACTFKLYVSPHIDDYLPVFAETVKILSTSKVYCFKTGSNYHGIMRPDKLVVYFDNFEDLKDTAQKIYHSTGNFSAQGVPFSAPILDTLMLSWGMDPPAGKRKPISWRLWITKELASGIVEGKKMLADEPWQYAVQYIRAKGFKTDTWEPNEDLFTKTVLSKN
jgi:hypothetical protein